MSERVIAFFKENERKLVCVRELESVSHGGGVDLREP